MCIIVCCMLTLQLVRNYVGHSANCGCSKCMKKFLRGVGSKEYSGFDRYSWEVCSNTQHQQYVALVKAACNKTHQQQLETLYGCCSVYLSCPILTQYECVLWILCTTYFWALQSKMMKNLWLAKNVLNQKQLIELQNTI